MQTLGDRRRIEQVTTENFWPSSAGAQLLSRAERAVGILNLDFQAGDATIMAVHADVAGIERVRLRVAYRSRSVTGSSVLSYLNTKGTTARPFPSPEVVAQCDQHGWYDWELVRPVGTQSARDRDGWRCGSCGAPFHSDLDVACSNCRAHRTKPEGAWLIDFGWLVVT